MSRNETSQDEETVKPSLQAASSQKLVQIILAVDNVIRHN